MVNQKGLSPILIVIILAVLVGGYLVYQNQPKPTPPQQTVQPSPTSVTSPAPTATEETANPDSIGANWKTYTDSESGYSIKYPSEFEIRQGLAVTSPNYPRILSTIVLDNRELGEIGGISINITVADSKTNLSLDNVLGQGPQLAYISDYLKGKNIQTLKVDNMDAVMVDGITAGPGDSSSLDLIVLKGNRVYQITMLPSTIDGSKILTRILSTFKFTN